MDKKVAKCWWFKSNSNPNKTYETLQYVDGSTSCNCMGWTRGGKRLDANGNRTCTHTRKVDAGIADQECTKSLVYEQTAQTVSMTSSVKHVAKRKSKKTQQVKAQPARKIVW